MISATSKRSPTRVRSRVAELLGVNHSTVFRRLEQIEQQLASCLFERGRGNRAPTASGERMIELAERMGENIVSFERTATGQDLRPSGELRVTTSDAVLLHLLSEILDRLPPRLSGDRARYRGLEPAAQSVQARRRRGGADDRPQSRPARAARSRIVGRYLPAALAGQPFDPRSMQAATTGSRSTIPSRPARQRNGSTSTPAGSASSTR